MTNAIKIERVINACLAGISDAQIDYESWSGGYWLWKAPEYLATVFVARQLAALNGAKYVTVENGANEAIEDAGARGRGRLHRNIRSNGRFDILLWWGNSKPRAPIEVKRHVRSIKAIESDLHRIKSVIMRGIGATSFQFGLVVFYTSCVDGKNVSASDKLNKRLRAIEKESKELLGLSCRTTLFRSDITVERDSAWVSACILILPI